MKNVIFATVIPKRQTAPPGQIAWTTPGTYIWTVPAGVYEVSGVIIAAGAYANSTNSGGDGGGLRYRNKFPVTPGTKLTVVVGSGVGGNVRTSSALDMTVGLNSIGTPFSTDVKGGYGSKQGNPNQNQGGLAGTYTNGTDYPLRLPATGGFKGGLGTSVLGSSAPRNSAPTGVGGPGGGGAGWGGNNGGNGAVRIMWGESRAYPNTSVADVAA